MTLIHPHALSLPSPITDWELSEELQTELGLAKIHSLDLLRGADLPGTLRRMDLKTYVSVFIPTEEIEAIEPDPRADEHGEQLLGLHHRLLALKQVGCSSS